MTEYIGARISLISKSDIRYSGFLHEINSENSTVALENVTSFGTEGRRSSEEEVPPSDHIYEYIVFRGSDVKDLKIEQQPKESKPQPPAVPNDPAILGAARPPQPQGQQAQGSRPQPGPAQPPGFGQGPFPPQYPPYPPFAGRGFPPQGGFPGGPPPPGAPAGFPNYPGYPPYGPPPGWQGAPGQGFPPMPNQFSPPPGAIGAPGQPAPQHPAQGPKGAQAPLGGPGAGKDESPKVAEADSVSKVPEPKSISKSTTPVPPAGPRKAPTPPVDSKPDVAAALAAPAQVSKPAQQKPVPTGPKGGRIVPAIPLANTGPKTAAQVAAGATAAAPQPGKAAAAATAAQSYQDNTQAATAAVAAAMAKLKPQGPKGPESDSSAMDNLARKVAEMRADDKTRHPRGPGTGGYAAGNRGGGPRRGGPRHQHHAPKVEVPTTDFDFESANAKFNKQDLVKEAIATGSPMGDAPSAALNGASADTNGDAKNDDVVIPGADKPYDRTASFFDNISSELRDREESKKFGGQEFRSEERKKNLETFGQGSVDGFRGGYRGRGGFRGGRGRGRGGGQGFGRGRGRGGGQGGFAPRGPGAPGQAAETS